MTSSDSEREVLPRGSPPGVELRETPVSGEPYRRFVLAGWENAFPGLAAGITAAGEGADFGFTTSPSAWELVGRARSLSEQLGFSRVAMVRQVHGCDVRSVEGEGRAGVLVADDADGLVVGRGDGLACVTAADCVPVYLIDPPSARMALLHAGWRGSTAGVLEAGLRALVERGGDPMDFRIHLGPAICGGCYEVGAEVLRAFGMPGRERGHVDLRHLLAERATAAGVREARVTRSGWCTQCSPDHFHSHRGRGDRAGRMAAYLGWKQVDDARERPGS